MANKDDKGEKEYEELKKRADAGNKVLIMMRGADKLNTLNINADSKTSILCRISSDAEEMRRMSPTCTSTSPGVDFRRFRGTPGSTSTARPGLQ